MTIKSFQMAASWFILFAIIGKMLGIQEQIAYGIFFFGFFLFVASLETKSLPLRLSFLFLMPIIAIQFPIPIPEYIPPLIRLAIIMAIWIATYLLVSFSAALREKKSATTEGS